jgi:hypothetical protein
VAHALERPKRPRNAAFFQTIAPELAALPAYARSRASVLLDTGAIAEATPLLESLHAAQPNDGYVILRLAEAHARAENNAALPALAQAVVPADVAGPPEHRMAVAQLLRQQGRISDALVAGYHILCQNPNNARVALGYTGLFLIDPSSPVTNEPGAVAPHTFVRIECEGGELRSFVVDDGPTFWGIEALSLADPLVHLILGKKNGDIFEVPRRYDPETWKIKEIKTKYLHALHVIMDDFEWRFPDADGLWQVRTRDQDITPILDITRARAEANRETAGLYIDNR